MFTDPIIEHARRRFTEETQLSWDDFLRLAYIREARKQDALVVDLGSGDPLTEDEVMRTDPYALAVMYEDGSLSKDWRSQPVVTQSEAHDFSFARSPKADATRYERMVATY